MSSVSPLPSHFFTHRVCLSITLVLIWKGSRKRGKNQSESSWNDILDCNVIMNWPQINYWKQNFLWCLRRMCLCVTATSLHVHLSLNRAWYRHKNWFYGNFRILVPWTLHLNANFTDVHGTKWIKLESAKPLFSPLLLLQLKSSCLKCRGPPSWGLPAHALTGFWQQYLQLISMS